MSQIWNTALNLVNGNLRKTVSLQLFKPRIFPNSLGTDPESRMRYPEKSVLEKPNDFCYFDRWEIRFLSIKMWCDAGKDNKKRQPNYFWQYCGTGTVGTGPLCLSGTRTVIKWNHKRREDKFLGNNADSINIRKRKIFLQKKILNCFLWSRYGTWARQQ